MPITTRDDTTEGIRWSIMSGDVTGAELIDAYRPATGSHEQAPPLGLVDMRDVRTLDVSSSAIWELTQLLGQAERGAKPRRVAIVACTDFTFGMARMFETLASNAGARTEYQVFRDMSRAREWLGLAPNGGRSG